MLPEDVKKELERFLFELPIEKFSKEWEAVQAAISMLNFPKSFKKGTHVFLTSYNRNHEEGCYDDKEMSIKIYPQKVVMSRRHAEYNSFVGIDRNKVYRYITPSDKYGASDFQKVMSDLSGLFTSCYYTDSSDASGVCYSNANFSIITNVK